MNEEKIKLFSSFSDYQRVNDRFAKVKIRIAYDGENRNGSYISKEAFERASYTLKFCPVVGYWLEDDKEFDGHTEKVEIIGDEWNFKTLTQPYGVVTDEAPFWENVKTTNGEIKSYYCCYAMLWIGRYPELEAIKERDFKQSMEILPKGNSGYNSVDSLYHIEDFTFDALCILEAKEPCFEDSTISLNYSKSDFESDYKTMMNELKEYTFSLMQEGGDAVEEEVKEVEMAEEEVVAEEVTMEEEVVETEEQEMAKDEEKKCEEEPEDDEQEDEVEEDYQAKYSELLTKYEELEVEYGKLQSQFSSIEGEVVELREYKAEKEKEIRMTKEEEVFEKFNTELNGNEDFESLKEKASEYSLEELENKCFALLGRIKFSAKKPNKKEKQVIFNHVETSYEETEKVSKYDLTIQKYLKK